MHIVCVRWYAYRIPLRRQFITAHGSMAMREGAIIELFTSREDIVGVGEIAPLPDFGGGDLDEALAALPRAVDELRGRTIEEALQYLQDMLFVGKLPASTVCGLEIALLDALGKAQGDSISSLLNAERDSTPHSCIPVNAVIGAQEVAAAVQQAELAVEAGFACIKLKMGDNPQCEIKRVKAVREAIGSGIHLRLDANESWTFEQALTILTACADLHIQYVEQPLPARDIRGMGDLQRAVSIPLAADEAVYDLASVRSLLQTGAVQVLIIKPQLAGGLSASREMLRLASQEAVNCVVTSVFEAGIGLAAILHLVATAPEITWACGLATLDRLVDDLLLDDLSVRNGMIAVPVGSGLGVSLDRKALLKYSRATGEV